jgi:hypothetical protein
MNQTGGSGKEKNVEYTAQAVSPIVNGEVKLRIDERSFIAAAVFDTAEVPFTSVNAIEFADHVVTVRTDDGDYVFSRMGQWAQPFYDELYGAYNKMVLRAFFVSGKPDIAAKGDYRFVEDDTLSGKAPVEVYSNCVVATPPNSDARRIPLCFTTGMDKGTHELTLKLNSGEAYTFSKLGYDTAPFSEAVERNVRELRNKALTALKDIDYTMSTTQASQLAKLIPEGAAAPIGQLAAIAPSFAAAIEEKISKTRAADSYKVFKGMCDPAQIWVGFRKNEAPENEKPKDPDEEPPETYLFWMIAPSPCGKYAAVEFAEANTATFVYRINGKFSEWAMHLNRALEAISFKREVIRLTDDELLKPEYAEYYMAAKRTASLQFIRKNFVGRLIHSSPEAWKRKLIEAWSGGKPE